MDKLINKSYKTYSSFSRYSTFPIYYNTADEKYESGTTSQLDLDTPYQSYEVQKNDTYDSIALNFYNNPIYYWIICDFNRKQDPFEKPKVGEIIKIPVFSSIEFLNI